MAWAVLGGGLCSQAAGHPDCLRCLEAVAKLKERQAFAEAVRSGARLVVLLESLRSGGSHFEMLGGIHRIPNAGNNVACSDYDYQV